MQSNQRDLSDGNVLGKEKTSIEKKAFMSLILSVLNYASEDVVTV